MYTFLTLTTKRPASAILLLSLTIGVTASSTFAQQPGPTEKSRQLSAAKKEKREALNAELRNALLDGDTTRARVIATELGRSRIHNSAKASSATTYGSDPESIPKLQIWTQFYMAQLALQPTDPVKATSLALKTVSEITTSIPALPEGDQGAAWLLLGGFQEHLIGDGLAAIAAYGKAEGSSGVSSVFIRERIEALNLRIQSVR